MRLTLGRLALTAVLAGVVLCGTTAFAQNASGETRVNIRLEDADLVTLTKAITLQTGIQFVFQQGDPDKMSKLITLNLQGSTVEDVLRYACQAAGAYFRRDDNGVYLISFTKPEPEVVKPPITTPGSATTKIPKKLHRFKMLKADAEQVLWQMKNPDVAWDMNDGFKKLNDFDKLVRRPSAYEGGSRIHVPALGTGPNSAGNTFQPMSSQAFGTPRVETGGNGNGIDLPGFGADQGGGPGGGPGGGGPGGGGGGGGAGGGGGGQGALSTGGLIPSTIDYITFDPVTNSIIVQGTDEEIRALQDAISFFDVAPRQVQVKVEFITTSTSQARSLGFDWLYSRGTVFTGNVPGSFARSGDPIFLNFASGNFTSRMRALLQEGGGKVVSAPVLRTLNNQPAQVTQGTQTTIFINQVIGIGNGNVITQSIPQPITVQTTLAVRPRINEDGTITMFLAPSISDLGQLRRGPDGQEVPDILFQQIAVVARVRDGETVGLSGLTRKQDVGSTSRFPVLGDLPIIGQFFRSTSRDLNYTELMIFVTPTVIADEDIEGIGP